MIRQLPIPGISPATLSATLNARAGAICPTTRRSVWTVSTTSSSCRRRDSAACQTAARKTRPAWEASQKSRSLKPAMTGFLQPLSRLARFHIQLILTNFNRKMSPGKVLEIAGREKFSARTGRILNSCRPGLRKSCMIVIF